MTTINKLGYTILLLTLGLASLGFCQVSQQEENMLFESVRDGNLQQMLVLLDKGIDVNCRDAYQYTPLIIAAKYGRAEIAEKLCDRGAKVNAVSNPDLWAYGEDGYSSLHWAAFNCDSEMARILVGRGAEVDQFGGTGETPLMIASRRNCKILAGFLIDKGADVNKVNDEDQKTTALVEAVKNGHLDIVDLLMNKGAKYIIRTNLQTSSLLSIAVANSHLAVVRYLIEKGLPVNGRDQDGSTAIHFALRPSLESRYILEYLVEQGGDCAAKNILGTSPLMQASLYGLAWEAEFLIGKGAPVNDTDSREETALHYACRGILSKPQEGYCKGMGLEATIRLLLDKGAKVNAKDHLGKTPLMFAAIQDIPGIAEILLNKGTLINAQDNFGWTALMYAAYWNQTGVIKVLAAHGADLNLRNSKGETALELTRQKQSSAQAYELLKYLGAK